MKDMRRKENGGREEEKRQYPWTTPLTKKRGFSGIKKIGWARQGLHRGVHDCGLVEMGAYESADA